uniref:Uncharacterized protein n=1 Tax=Moniliophthora roreri TaxID=221103 RepID=A0A0W0ETG2_MONRR
MQSQTHLVGLLQAFGDLIPNTSHLAASDLASRCPYDLDLLKIRPTRQIHGDTKDPVHRRVARILDVLLAFSGCSASSNDSMTMSLRVTPNLVRMNHPFLTSGSTLVFLDIAAHTVSTHWKKSNGDAKVVKSLAQLCDHYNRNARTDEEHEFDSAPPEPFNVVYFMNRLLLPTSQMHVDVLLDKHGLLRGRALDVVFVSPEDYGYRVSVTLPDLSVIRSFLDGIPCQQTTLVAKQKERLISQLETLGPRFCDVEFTPRMQSCILSQ